MTDHEASPSVAPIRDAIVAWRAWQVVGERNPSEVRLLPLASGGSSWPTLRPARAGCAKRRRHRSPDPSCTCGLYATRSLGDLPWARGPGVLGRVAVWGRVIEHELGYRAEHGYPQRLRLLCSICCWLPGATRLGSPTMVVRHRGGRLVPLCAPHLDLARGVGYPAHHVMDAAPVERALLDAYAVDPLPPL